MRRRAIALDIDGVLLRGSRVLPAALPALQKIVSNKIPFVLLTNGGGELERDRAARLSDALSYPIRTEQVILSHTPMKHLLATSLDGSHDGKVLVIGPAKCVEVAKEYGWKGVVGTGDIHAADSSIWPFKEHGGMRVSSAERPSFKIKHVVMMHDSPDWGLDLQICMDAILSKGGLIGAPHGNTQQAKVYFSNGDFEFSGEFQQNRLAQGAFRRCLQALYAQRTGSDLQFTQLGKPESLTYRYAEKVLGDVGQIYAVGDNPASDIVGGNTLLQR